MGQNCTYICTFTLFGENYLLILDIYECIFWILFALENQDNLLIFNYKTKGI